MSGGYFNYGCFRILQFADDLKHEIEINGDDSIDGFGDRIGQDFDQETLSRLVAAHKIIDTAGKLAREVEWLYSSDHGEESFCRIMDDILTASAA